MRVVLSIIALLTALGANVVHAQDTALQSGTETPEEIVVRGTRLADFRVEVERAREHAYDIFNEINSNDDFDVLCRDETRHFSHSKIRVCRARFENRISSQAAKEYMATLSARCPPDAEGAIQWQTCMFSGVGQTAKSNAQAVEGQAPSMHDRMNDEILRLARTDLRFGQAILEFFEASEQYESARQRFGDED